MVDLARTEAQMLTEIEFHACRDRETPAAERRMSARTPGEVLPALRQTFSGSYAHVPDEHVSYDLIAVVKKGLGNAYKWGNRRDPAKLLIVTTALTRMGAVIKISDQGNGFDVPRVVRDRLFTRKGSGLHRFEKTSSVISYADGGRTLLIRFLCDAEAGSIAAGTRVSARGRLPSSTQPIDLDDLRLSDQVKVKGILEPNGTVLAKKVTRKLFEEFEVIEAPLQHVSHNERVIRLLNLDIALPENADFMNAGRAAAGCEPRAGLVVWLTGRYAPGQAFAPVTVRIRPGQSGDTTELRGRIESIDRSGRQDFPCRRHQSRDGCRYRGAR